MNPRNSPKKDSVCIVCCRPISIFSYGSCDHPICYECSTRIRVLCKQNECPICRADLPMVLFSRIHKPLQEVNGLEYEAKYQIYFESSEVRAAFEKLLEHACQKCYDRPAFEHFRALKDHMRREHERYYCDLCVENLRIFSSERKTYTRQELAMHRREGDADDTSYRDHPLCEFCDRRFFDSDELYRHTRKEHHYCHFCEDEGLHFFFRSIGDLKEHFRKDHFLCEEGKCKDEEYRYVAFKTDIDGKAHMAKHHWKNLPKAQLKQARMLEVQFTIKPRPNQRNSHQRNAVVSANDFEEVDAFNRKGYHGGRKPRDHNFHPGNSSLAESAERNNNNAAVQSFEPLGWFPDQTINTQCEKEFPQLGSAVSAKSSGNAFGNTLANRLAQTNHFIASEKPRPKKKGGIDVKNEEEFPVLGPSKSTLPGAQSRGLNFPTSSTNGNRGSRQSVSVRFGNKDDRPPANVSIRLSAKQNGTAKPTSVVESKDAKLQSADVQMKPAKKNKFEDDFPALGGAAKPMRKLNFSADVAGTNVNASETAHRNVDSASIENSATKFQQVDPQKESSNSLTKKKAKKKKQKAKTEESISKDEDAKTNDVSSLAKVSEALLHPSKVESHDAEGLEQESEESECEKPSAAEVEPKICSNKDIPRAASFVPDDFPSLPASQRKVPLPPGFSNVPQVPKPTAAPPGFSNNQSVEPTSIPGITISLSSVARQLTAGESAPRTTSLTFTNSNGETFPLGGQPQFAAGFIYAHPPNFQKRNQMLICKIQDLVNDEDMFVQFRSISSQFRQNKLPATEYHKKCLDLLGHDGFMEILPELLVLLPDITKQQELLSAHNAYSKNKVSGTGALPKKASSGSRNQFLVCATCQQVLTGNDFKNHMLVHGADSFPASIYSNHNSQTA